MKKQKHQLHSNHAEPVKPLDSLGLTPLENRESEKKTNRAKRIGAGVVASTVMLAGGALLANGSGEGTEQDKPTPTTIVKVGPGDTLRSLSDEQSQELRRDPQEVFEEVAELNNPDQVQLGDVVSLPSSEEHNKSH